MKRLLVTVAHPDDEAFGPAGTIAKYANAGGEIHLLCATRGEGGEMYGEKNHKSAEIRGDEKLGNIREKELIKSAKVLGVAKVEFLDFIDGTLCNANYHQLAGKIIKKIKSFKPQVIVTLDRLGISGHLDHIAVSMVTTFAYLKTNIANKLYYHVLPRQWYVERMKNYFIYFHEGYKNDEITTRIDFSKYWGLKKEAMMLHKSQRKDALNILKEWKKRKKIDHFILQYHRGIKVNPPPLKAGPSSKVEDETPYPPASWRTGTGVKLPETDLFNGIKY